MQLPGYSQMSFALQLLLHGAFQLSHCATGPDIFYRWKLVKIHPMGVMCHLDAATPVKSSTKEFKIHPCMISSFLCKLELKLKTEIENVQ